jgi:hypothetical protein
MSSELALLVLGVWAICAGLVAELLVLSGRHEDGRRVSFRLHFPRDLRDDSVTSAMRALAGLPHGSPFLFRSLVFEVFSQQGGIEHYLHVPLAWVDSVRAQLAAGMPGVRLEQIDAVRPPTLSRAREFNLADDWQPLRSDAIPASVSSLLAVLQPLRRDETVIMQWVARPAGTGPAPRPGRSRPTEKGPWWLRFLLAFWRAPQVEPMSLVAQRAKTGEPLFGVIGRLGVRAADPVRAGHLLRRLRSGLAAIEAPGAVLTPRLRPESWNVRRLAARRTPQWSTSRFNARELATVIAWPIGAPAVPGLVLARSRYFAPASVLPRTGRVLGDAADERGPRPVAQRLADAVTHTWMLGATGSGKSTLLANLIAQDLVLPERPAVVVIEPKGDLCADVLRRVPEKRRQDVIYLDAASDVLVGLNPLRPDEPDRELVADEVYGVFRQVSASWGPRLGDVLHTALLTLVRQPDACLTELPLLLGDDAYRRRVVGSLGDDAWTLRPVWAWYDGLNPAERSAVAAPILTRVRPWIVRSRLRHLLGVARPRWSFREVLDQNRILLVVLNPGLLGRETASLLGALVLQGVWQAARGRGSLTPAKRRPALVYVDEWQEFTRLPTDLGEVLAQARGYRLGMVLANQSAAQLSPELRAAVSANARSKIALAVDAQDAALMARELGGGVAAEDLHGLGAYQAVASLMVNSETAPPVSIKTRSLVPPLTEAEVVRRVSQQRYGLDPDEVERAIRARHEPEPPTGAVRRRRRS